MTKSKINIARDFTQYPTGRLRANGRGSGEQFRDEYLLPELQNGNDVSVEFDGARGYPASFLEEAFGGLIRLGISKEEILSHLSLTSKSASYDAYVMLAWDYIMQADARTKKSG